MPEGRPNLNIRSNLCRIVPVSYEQTSAVTEVCGSTKNAMM